MTGYPKGFIDFRTTLLLILACLLAIFAFQKFNGLQEQTRINEAFHMAGESKTRVTEFYFLSARFPTTQLETESVTTDIYAVPEFVSEIVIEQGTDFDVMVKVFLKDVEVSGQPGTQPFVYMAANLTDGTGRDLDWTCGARGIESDLLPKSCRS
jgi:hypothetical protein